MDLDTIIQGDALTVLRDMKEQGIKVNCVVSSPPYWGLRDYGVPGQLGLESTPEEYVERMVEIFRAVRDVMAEDATLWLNLGDSYCGSGINDGTKNPGISKSSSRGEPKQRHGQVPDGKNPNAPIMEYQPHRQGISGLKPKDLVGIPWRVAFALQADGWWLRQDIIWAKPNPMPESVTDRCTKAHEYIFLLSKSKSYFYDAEAVKEPLAPGSIERCNYPVNSMGGPHGEAGGKISQGADRKMVTLDPSGRNKRSVWAVATEPYPEAHFATYPQKLIEPCILAGTSQKGHCPACGRGWKRITQSNNPNKLPVSGKLAELKAHNIRNDGNARMGDPETKTVGWASSCTCGLDPTPGIVLDPFMGSGTTALVAERLGRHWLGIELNPEYIELAEKRVAQESLLKIMGGGQK